MGTIFYFYLTLVFIAFTVFSVLQYLNIRYLNTKIKLPAPLDVEFSDSDTLKSNHYTRDKAFFGWIKEAFDVTLLVGFLSFGGLTFLESSCPNFLSSFVAKGLWVTLSVMVLSLIKDLPFNLYHQFILEEKHGFNNMNPSLFFIDLFKGLFLSILLGIPILALIFSFLEKFPLWGWLIAFVSVAVFKLFIIWVYPKWFMPWFNKFDPLKDEELKKDIFSIAGKVNFPIKEIYQMDGSKRSKHSNAFFTGLGKNKRIVLFDTLIESLSNKQMIAVLAHEIGHSKCNHISKSMIVSFIFMFLGFYILGFLYQQQWLFQGFGVSFESKSCVLILFSLLSSPILFLLNPLFTLKSRKNEFEADAFSFSTCGEATGLIESLIRLSKDNQSNLNPHPWYSCFYYSHPTLVERINALKKLEMGKNK